MFQQIRNEKSKAIAGLFLILFSLFFALSLISYFIFWKEDQSQIIDLWNSNVKVKNFLGKVGVYIAHIFVYNSFGISAFLLPYLMFILGVWWLFKKKIAPLLKTLFRTIILSFWISLSFGFLMPSIPVLGGRIGYALAEYMTSMLGNIGVVLFLIFYACVYIILNFSFSSKIRFNPFAKKDRKSKKDNPHFSKEKTNKKNDFIENEYTIESPLGEDSEHINLSIVKTDENDQIEIDGDKSSDSVKTHMTSDEMEITVLREEEPEDIAEKIVQRLGKYDPHLELSDYKFPGLDLLRSYENEDISVNELELEENKNKIVKTLGDYKIDISKIKATIGPTITLYEIVPAPGVKISKIRSLEDDIALGLSALGIRIIAPIPGKGTIGIEVPNSEPTIVSMRSILASKKFQNTPMELPCAIGKTISNETFIVDLAKMPHLLMAGATGQGKSVGLNAILTSLLYKKHPSEVKFVLVDPKKVELTLFNKIERHFLAKLPNSEDAIITDTTKVIYTLNSLCIEMDSRYELLKDAMVRNIKEYNEKFLQRRLNPENGHHYLPYIVLVIDEFSDLIMTAGKEVETPIARLAQLARAIGIHLIIATQRPSVNVITGIIKANFPARIAFRVTSKIDSRTILDIGGADQLIGKGDMLYSSGSEIVRLQCAFIDTSEVEDLTEFIGSQRAYPKPMMLPEYEGEEENTKGDIDLDDRDSKFEEAARLVVINQQGSTSFLQRKLKLGYNRAGRIIDQLEASGIIGPFEGSKSRQVLITDINSLEIILNDSKKKDEKFI
ncbi:FtsK/SpoIIIE family DNA translocase [Ichthyobacterium seriolicida]|uniref:Cell division protein FtsK n=1 Tax=Ichthyobacterium seriolicida TaxID=242600 RepID=A0A1J1DXT8_9FLAO|nr:DNA translocase FtsK [Ichthyobacterium seriolicida]BAV94687.1 cell division protein FtsK [Ichthyobacterium seriolicida]